MLGEFPPSDPFFFPKSEEFSSAQPTWDPFALIDYPSDSLTLCGINNFRDEDLWFLNYSKITHLKIVECNGLTDRALSFLPSSLTSLEIIGCKHFSDEGLSSLGLLRKLKTLTLQGCEGIEGLSFGSLPSSLTSLRLFNCTHISDEAISTLRPLNLTALWIVHSQNLTGKSLGALPSSLKTLKIEACPWVVDRSLENLTFLSNLTTVNLAFCEHIHGRTLNKLPSSVKNLSLKGCLSLSCLEPLTALPSLTTLDLSLTKITDIYLPFLCELNLKRLIINDCSFTLKGLKHLSERLRLPLVKEFRSKKEKGICSNFPSK